MTGHRVRLERLVDATPDVAFDAWNDADTRVQWHKAQDHWVVEASTELRVGGRWRVACGPALDEMYVEEGVYEVVDPPHRVVYTCVHRIPGRPVFETRVAVTFERRGDRTLVTLVDDHFPDDDLRRQFAGGWPAFLDSFVRIVALR